MSVLHRILSILVDQSFIFMVLSYTALESYSCCSFLFDRWDVEHGIRSLMLSIDSLLSCAWCITARVCSRPSHMLLTTRTKWCRGCSAFRVISRIKTTATSTSSEWTTSRSSRSILFKDFAGTWRILLKDRMCLVVSSGLALSLISNLTATHRRRSTNSVRGWLATSLLRALEQVLLLWSMDSKLTKLSLSSEHLILTDMRITFLFMIMSLLLVRHLLVELHNLHDWRVVVAVSAWRNKLTTRNAKRLWVTKVSRLILESRG